MKDRHNFATFDYGDFISDDTLSKGWVTFDPRPRYATNYYGLRARIALLSEAYSHDPFRRRIASTYAFAFEIFSYVAERPDRVMALTRAASNGPSSRARIVKLPITLRSTLAAAPESAGVTAEIMANTGDSTRAEAGVPKGRRRTGR